MSTRLTLIPLLALLSSAAHADPPPALDEVHRLQLAIVEANPICSALPGSLTPCRPGAPSRQLLRQLRNARPGLTDAELAILAGEMEHVTIAFTSPTTFTYEIMPAPSTLSFPCFAEFTLRGTGTRGTTIILGKTVQGRQLRECNPSDPQ
jgi:hypothetical protein